MAKKLNKTKQYKNLIQCFDELLEQGILYNAGSGYTQSDAISDLAEIFQAMPPERKSKIWGYCLYHEQDAERALKTQILPLSFGALNDEQETVIRVGQVIVKTLHRFGFLTKWNGTEDHRIEICSYQ
jgi:hypothetical protein